MLKGRGRDPRGAVPPTPTMSRALLSSPRPPSTPTVQRALLARPEPDYEVVEFPSDQYVNAKLNPPPPPPPRPPTGHPAEAGASCGLCGGGGARVRCAECGRRALCASCDDMYHRHPKRRNHQRQALTSAQLREERPPLPPKTGPPVPPPRRHKVGGDRMSASPKPPAMDQRRATLGHLSNTIGHINHGHVGVAPVNNHLRQHPQQQLPLHLQTKLTSTPTKSHVGSMPFLPTAVPHVQAPIPTPQGHHTLGPGNAAWARQRGSLHGFNVHQTPPPETWESEGFQHNQNWGRPLRKGASVLELGGGAPCSGCAQCSPATWRYGSCASLDHPWQSGWQPPTCCLPPQPQHDPRLHMHPHHIPHTPQMHRRANYENRGGSRAASRAGSRAASPALSVRSRTSRRAKPRSPSPDIPSSDADSESEGLSDTPPDPAPPNEDSLGPPPPAPHLTWQCEHCTFVNEPGVRVCVVCCRTPTTAPKVLVSDVKEDFEKLKISSKKSSNHPAGQEPRNDQNGIKSSSKSKKERVSTSCGTSPPREERQLKQEATKTTSSEDRRKTERPRERHDMAVGPSPPREVQRTQQNFSSGPSPPRDISKTVRVSPYRDTRESATNEPRLHSISVGCSPPREISVSSSPKVQKKSTGTSPPRDVVLESRHLTTKAKTNVSNTGTSPPPQSISTQTYEVPKAWERAASASRSRPRRRFREDNRRERSRSRHSLSSDTRESERSVRTLGTNERWEWRERDSSPGAEWGENGQLSRRASHLDLRRPRSHRRSGFYGSEAPSPEPTGATRTTSLEALAGVGARRETERGLELAKLMTEAERLGFSAAEVQAALTQSPAAPLAWLRSRWPSLCAGVRAAAARLAPEATISELEARAALARHRGAMWPAVTECVERHRRQTETMVINEEGRLRGRVWGSPAGVEDDAVPPRVASRRSSRARAEDSSDEFEAPTRPVFRDDDWMFLPLDVNVNNAYETGQNHSSPFSYDDPHNDRDNVALAINFLNDKTVEDNFLRNLLLDNTQFKLGDEAINNLSLFDLVQSENDFIDAYNALTKATPLPNVDNAIRGTDVVNNDFATDIQNVATTLIKSDQRNHSDKHNNFNQRNTFDQNNVPSEIPLKQETVLKVSKVNKLEKKPNKSGLNNTSDSRVNNVILDTRRLQEEKPFKSTNVVQDIEQAQTSTEEKAQNLNEIVDNTQKLIQLMKEEINSDINSYDNENISHSEHETTSNDEKESSYSDSSIHSETNGSDNTSGEDESSSTEEDNNIQIQIRHSAENINRPSSEDNEQFEEAMDHIDNQVEDFKNANMEMLNSIARSLQEDQATNIDIKIPESKVIEKQDLNNNLFVEVSSFEEIYAELNTKNLGKRNQQINDKPQNNNIKVPNTTLPDLTIFEKYTLNLTEFKCAAPNQISISEIKHPTLKATIENIEDDTKNTINIKKDSLAIELHNGETPMDLPSLPEFNSTNIQRTHIDYIDSEPIQLNNTIDYHYSINTDIEQQYNKPKPNNHANSNEIKSAEPPQELKSSEILVENLEETVEQNSNEIITEPPEEPKSSENVITNFDKNIEQTNNEINTTEAPLEPKSSETVVRNVDKNIEQSSNQNNTMGPPQKPKSSETIVTNPEKNIKSYLPSKSNIPKLIKTALSNKFKSDKTPKLVVSKVPVRRASIKQYPAPAPPKVLFGNVQSNNVKQLQTKLFNDKSKTSTGKVSTPEHTDAIPSTSTMNKKKLAPQPPANAQVNKQATPPKTLEAEEKKRNYFRETCRTEDEWTDSDSEDSQIQIKKTEEEQPLSPPSPPPPITLRRVSGHLIDLAKVQLPDGSPERQARMLLAEGATETWEQAQLAVELISRGIEAPAALLAALECTDMESALAYLHQDCELCASRLPEHEMVSMLRCTHRCCRECARHYFTVQITERSIADCVCPYCKVPDLENLPEDAWLDYFAHLDILLKTLLEIEVHELFQRKLRDRTLARDPNFRWCMECSSGFFVHPKQKKLRCPECRSVSCASCRKRWTANHEGITCEQYTAWLEDNDPERSMTAIQQHLRDNGLECPRCHFKYSLSRGGCMHFTCTQCKYEFCYGCGKPFTMGARCGLSEYCAKLGLHAHHPRNCLFYLRDKEPHELQTLLQMNNVTYETEPCEGNTGRCPVQLQRETPTGLVDSVCGSEAPAKFAGLCKPHYVEHLAGLARGLDPIPIMDVPELVAELRRRALPLPERGPWDTDPIYAGMCAEIVKEKIPLD